MLIYKKISTLALDAAAGMLGEIVGVPVEKGVEHLHKHFTDHSQKLASTLATANEKAWKTIEIALGGGNFLDRFASGDQKALCRQMQQFLASSVSEDNPGYLTLCLKELRQAKDKGHLRADGGFKPETLAEEIGPLARFDDPEALLDAECKAVQEVARELLRLGYKHLGRLLAVTPSQGQPLLALSAQYYFREAVSKDPALAAQLQWIKLIAIDRRANEGFAFLALIQEKHGESLEAVLDGLARVEVRVDQIHDGVLYTHEEMRRLNQEFKLFRQELTAGHSFSIRDERERALITEVKRRYRALSDDQRERFPRLGLELSRLEIVAGDYKEALVDAKEAAKAIPDALSKAKAHHAAYRAALELKKKDEALAELRLAAAADARFAIWDARKHEVVEILGAGAFGVALLCRNLYLGNRLVVIKTFEASGLERGVDKIFSEAGTLDALHHPGIIKLIYCDFVDAANKQRPYLEIEHFAGSLTLEEHVNQHGKLSLEDLREVAILTAQALQAAHKAGVLHRDLKPANLLVRKTKDGWGVKVIDFGLSLRRSLVQTSQAHAASLGKSMLGSAVAGTLHYAAPEQLDPDKGEVGEHSDVYGFGRTCYLAHFGEPDPDPDEIAELPKQWSSFLVRCNKKKVEQRLKDFATVLAELTAIGAPVVEKPTVSGGTGPVLRPRGSEAAVPPPGPESRTRAAQDQTRDCWEGSKAGEEQVIRFKDQEIRFRWCPPTSKPFLMGSPKNQKGRFDDEDQVEVTLSRGFWMQETPVTQGLWNAVMGTQEPGFWKKLFGATADPGFSTTFGKGPNFPVYYVNHSEAVKFAETLTNLLRDFRLIRNDEKLSLPTEAQWEYAARAGTTTRYHFGDDESKLVDYAWYSANAGGRTHEVKTRKPNPWGLHDMLGNVWEWCADVYQAKLPGGTDPCPMTGPSRVIRGGAWYFAAGDCAAAYRSRYEPSNAYNDLGLRVARVPSGA